MRSVLNRLFRTFVESPDFRRKSFSVRFFPCLLDNFFRSLLTEIFDKQPENVEDFIFKLNMVGLQLNCRDIRTCHSYDVIKLLSKLHTIVQFPFLFTMVQKLINLSRITIVIVKNKVEHFS